MSYQALVAKVSSVEAIPGCDLIHLALVSGYRIIVNKDTQPGDIGLLFESGGVLSTRFAHANDLVARKDENGKRAGGFFEANRRVRAIKMKGVRSEGFFCLLGYLAKMFDETPAQADMALLAAYQLKPGDVLTSFLGEEVCRKYETESTQRWAKEKRLQARGETAMFRKHLETEPLKKMLGALPPWGVVYITEKLHGTSQRVAHVLDDVETTGLKRLWRKIRRRPTTEKVWTKLIGTRNVLLRNRVGGGYHGNEEFRHNVVQPWIDLLHKGEVVYGEVVGYTEGGGSIMAQHDSGKLKDPEFVKAYGKTITYAYGTEPGECAFYVYRITQVNEDAVAVELSWPQVQKRAGELGIDTVPTIERLLYGPGNDGEVQSPEDLLGIAELFVEQARGEPALPSLLDDRHPREGVCVRVESPRGLQVFKVKSTDFFILEGVLKDRPDYVDLEEAA